MLARRNSSRADQPRPHPAQQLARRATRATARTPSNTAARLTPRTCSRAEQQLARRATPRPTRRNSSRAEQQRGPLGAAAVACHRWAVGAGEQRSGGLISVRSLLAIRNAVRRRPELRDRGRAADMFAGPDGARPRQRSGHVPRRARASAAQSTGPAVTRASAAQRTCSSTPRLRSRQRGGDVRRPHGLAVTRASEADVFAGPERWARAARPRFLHAHPRIFQCAPSSAHVCPTGPELRDGRAVRRSARTERWPAPGPASRCRCLAARAAAARADSS